MSQPRTASGVRARVRAEMIAEILAEARRQLAGIGADGLSLRAISRELGMASSAIYRYFPSRDALLTQLIIDAYNSVGEAAETADSANRTSLPRDRLLSVSRAVRAWALTHRHEFALIFGSPVPGYAAPQDTIGPATRIPVVLTSILLDAAGQDMVAPLPPLPDPAARSLQPLLAHVAAIARAEPAPELPAALIARGVIAWTHLIGAISHELFGHRHNVIGDSGTDRAAFFDYEMSMMAELTGLSHS